MAVSISSWRTTSSGPSRRICFARSTAGRSRYCTPESYKGQSPSLYHNKGDGTFENVTRKAGVYDLSNKMLGVALIDYDNDGQLDVFAANDTQPNRLYRNKGDGTFTDVGLTAGVAFNEAGVARAGMGVDAADYDGSGRQSLLIGNFSNEMMALYANEGKGLFIDEAPASTIGKATQLTLTFACFFFDFDLDGLPDIFAANGHVADDISSVQRNVTYAQAPHLFHNRGGKKFDVLSTAVGTAFRQPMVARGAAYADYDRDGDLDLLVTTNNGPARLLRNDGPPARMLRVTTVGVTVQPRRCRHEGSRQRGRGAAALGAREDWFELSFTERAAVDVWPGPGHEHHRRRRDVAEWQDRDAQGRGRESGHYGPGRQRGREIAAHRPWGQVMLGRVSSSSSVWELGIGRWALSGALILAAAITVFSGQTSSDTDRERAYRANNVGVALLEQFDYEAAARSFREALKLHPSLDLARLNLAIALFYGGHTAEAAAEAKTAVERLPEAPHAYYVAGLIARAEDNLDAAAAAFERVLKSDPADPGTKVNLGQIALQQRQYDRALTLFREAVTAEPYNVTATYSIALALMRSGKPDEGRKAMQEFEQLRDSAYGVTYSQNYLAQGNYAEAIASTGAEPELVDPAAPAVTFSDATATVLPTAPAAGSRGGVALFDTDGDGDLDILEIGETGLRLLTNQRGVFADESVRAGLAAIAGAGKPAPEGNPGAIAGDYDNDGRPDLFLTVTGGNRLLHQKADGAFEDVTAKAGISQQTTSPAAAAFADVDHDGDLDIFIPGSPTRLLRNNGNGRFGDVAVQAAVSAPVRAVAVAATDYDNRRDIDLVILAASAAPLLYRNLRDGSFRDTAAASGLPAAGAYSALAVGDVNKDGFPDFFFGRPDQPGVFALSDGQARFRTAAAPDETRASLAAQFVDYDNDGLLDLLSISDTRARLFRNLGAGKWSDVSAAAKLSALTVGNVSGMALGDLDGDGDVDAALRTSGGLRIWKNDGGSGHASLRIRLTSRVSNRSAIGSRVEVRAGSLRQQVETSSSTPAVAPSDIVFGLGARSAADVVRVLWPSGILQAEAGQGTSPPLTSGALTITELDRKPSSCPYLFTWNGSRFEFVTDFMGGGEMGAWLAPRTWNAPDADEYVRITSSQLQAHDGRFELRVSNELEEAVFVDRLQLVAVDHPAGVDVFPNEGLKSPSRRPLVLTTTQGARPPSGAVDEHGHDVLSQISAVDRRYPDDFPVLPVRGYAEPHLLTLDLGTSMSARRSDASKGRSYSITPSC